MIFSLSNLLAICLSLALCAHAGRPRANAPPRPSVPVVTADDAPITNAGVTLPPLNTTYYFDQLIDHTNPSLGTFKQRYWHTYEYYEPGGPVIVVNGGETNGDGKLNCFPGAMIIYLIRLTRIDSLPYELDNQWTDCRAAEWNSGCGRASLLRLVQSLR